MDALNQRKPSILAMLRRTDAANSPMHLFVHGAEERRSRLFPDRKRIPGRKAKTVVIISLMLHIWGIRKIGEIRSHQRRKDADFKKVQRKTAPFLQAMSDLRWIHLEERNDKIVQDLLGFKDETEYKEYRRRFNQEDIWGPFLPRYPHVNNKTARNIKSYGELWPARYRHHWDTYNI